MIKESQFWSFAHLGARDDAELLLGMLTVLLAGECLDEGAILSCTASPGNGGRGRVLYESEIVGRGGNGGGSVKSSRCHACCRGSFSGCRFDVVGDHDAVCHLVALLVLGFRGGDAS